jgi:hypothetical protein
LLFALALRFYGRTTPNSGGRHKAFTSVTAQHAREISKLRILAGLAARDSPQASFAAFLAYTIRMH